MAIFDLYLTDSSGTFALDEKEIILEWLVFSDCIDDYSYAIVKQGTIASSAPMSEGGKAKGWYAPGTPYRLGNEWNNTCLGGKIEVYDRKIIRGSGDFEVMPGITVFLKGNDNPVVMWKARQRYATDEWDQGEEFASESNKVTIHLGYAWEDVPLARDRIDGRWVYNSAGIPFNPPTATRRKIPVYTITRREILNPLDKAIRYTNTVNDGYFYGALPDSLLMDSISCDFDGQAWRVSYNIKEKVEGWLTYLLDTGYHYRGWDGRLYPILGDDGLPVSEPAKLDGTGRVLWNQTLPGVNVGPFHKYLRSSFGMLRLPNPFLIDTFR